MTSLSEQIAALANVAPRDADVEDVDVFDDNTWARVGSGGGVGGRAGGDDVMATDLGAARYRAAIDMGEDPRYAGKTVTRQDLRRQRGEASDSDSDGDGDVDMGQDMPAAHTLGSGSEDEDDDVWGDADGATDSAAMATDDIEAELAALEADDAQALMKRQDSEESAEKAEHTRNQIRLYENTLEMRIKLQKASNMALRLPKQPARRMFVAKDSALGTALADAADAAQGLVDDLLDLQDSLVEHSMFEASPEDDHDDDMPSDPVDRQWHRINQRWNIMEPELVDVVSEWQQKLMFASGLSAKKQLKAINQDLRTQVDAALSSRDTIVARCRVQRTSATREFGSEVEYGVGAGVGGDPDTYDDPEFYQQMLREFIKTSSAAAAGAPIAGATRRRKTKNVDRKASKGRRLRYHPHPKLVNFMAPQLPPAPPLDLDSLHASLFKSRS